MNFMSTPSSTCVNLNRQLHISEYFGRPIISINRINKYDGENTTFHYNRHENKKLIIETIPDLEFMQHLAQHIQKNFKIIRYYGIYARHKEADNRLFMAISNEKHTILSFNCQRNSILLSLGYDPLHCFCYGNKMSTLDIYYRHKLIFLEELYEMTHCEHFLRPPR